MYILTNVSQCIRDKLTILFTAPPFRHGTTSIDNCVRSSDMTIKLPRSPCFLLEEEEHNCAFFNVRNDLPHALLYR